MKTPYEYNLAYDKIYFKSVKICNNLFFLAKDLIQNVDNYLVSTLVRYYVLYR